MNTFTVLRGGEVYIPDPVGKADVLLVDGRIARVGELNLQALDKTHSGWS